ncbi:MAG: hypothetical protein IJS67_00295 [Clostridia bacterium]|nr:hypothetical protein [Clostridia bacterium]
MYFVIDAILIALFVCVFWSGIKKGLAGNWVFNILRTIIAIGGAIGLAVGVYFLMDAFGWLSAMAQGVVRFFGNVSNNAGDVWDQDALVAVCKIIAFLPFALLTVILGYVGLYLLLGLVYEPFKHLRKFGWWKFVDNLLGSILNFAVYAGVVCAVFGVIHGINSGDAYKKVLGEANMTTPVNRSIEVALNGMHENLSAGPICGLVYEYNPLNGVFSSIFNK